MNNANPLTVADLWAYAKSQATIEATDYFDPRYPRLDEMAAWKTDVAKRNSQRRQILRTFPDRVQSTEPLRPGSYYGGRLVVAADSIHYIPGQCAALEIYAALFDYFIATETNDGKSN
jgi:hypothetical protein